MKQPYPYRELDYHWSQATYGIDSGLPVHAHGFLGEPFGVALVLFPQLLEFRLKAGHRAHLADLPEGKGCGDQAHKDGKSNDGKSHIAEENGVEEHQAVYHGPEDALVPNVRKEIG